MATRPVFIPEVDGTRLVSAVPMSFNWHPGMAPSQKKKNVVELHEAAEKSGLYPLLEISSKSEVLVGRRLSAFNLCLTIQGKKTPLECVFQASKVFEQGGPFLDLLDLTPREAKTDERLKNSGKLIKFNLEGQDYPISPATVFYDWIYLKAVIEHADWLRERLSFFVGFTDIEFNPERSINCQAKSVANFVSLDKRGKLKDAAKSFDAFLQYMVQSQI